MRTVIGLFGDRTEAMRAYTALQNEGFANAALDILTNDNQEDQPKLANLRRFVPVPDVDIYLEGVCQGGTIITANVADSMATRAAEILSHFNMVNIEQRAREMGRSDRNFPLSHSTTRENSPEAVEKDVQISGTGEQSWMQTHTVATQPTVQQDIPLQDETIADETINIQRQSTSRSTAMNPDLFMERTFELVEVDEVVLVGKTTRVVEEVISVQETGQRSEARQATLHRQDVAIAAANAVPALRNYEADFRAFYDANLTDSGATYESLKPAFNYGYGLAIREPFRNHPWSAIEADARRLWEQKNPGTWENHKGIIHYAWEKVRCARM